MMHDLERPPLTASRAMLLGTLTVGSLDLLDAIIFFHLRGVAPIRILQSIASGLLGKGAFEGGAATAILGTALHFFIAWMVVLTYYLASRRLPLMVNSPWVCGPVYGLLVYAVMNLIVVPLSRANHASPSTPVLINGLLIHALGVGLPSALFARVTRSTDSTGLTTQRIA
ncbi:MAG: hypothetical protein ABI587_01865 [Gemmatimonadales bacterium]